MTISIGSDPELMLRNRSTGRIISACGLIGGTKGAAIQMEGLADGFGVQEDNVMVEFNIPPAFDRRTFASSIDQGLNWIREYVDTRYPELELDDKPARILMRDQLETKGSQTFGCAPDFEAHQDGVQSEGVSPALLETSEGAWRFNGGHIHIGYEANVPQFVAGQFADLFLGLPSIGLDKQGLRRDNYGQAGRYRPCPYGIEYRTLSNFWLWDIETTKDVGRRAYELGKLLEVSSDKELRHMYGTVPWVDVRRAINTEDADMAADVLAFLERDLGMDI
jgi:hypothetical protein